MRHLKDTLLKLIEECSEVQQAVCKLMAFGPESRWPDEKAPSNLEHLSLEIGDLLAVIDVLRDETLLGLSQVEIEIAKSNKMKKLEIYLPHLDLDFVKR
jgi:NTP pyrophosphatase (non-canonical NTP hydrolase)